MNKNINDEPDAIMQNSAEEKIHDNLLAKLNKDVSDEEDRKYIYSLYLQLVTQQADQFSGNDQEKSDFFKELSGDELYLKNLLMILKILCQMHKVYGEDQKEQSNLVQLVVALSTKTSKAFLKLLREFTPIKPPLYTVTDENNNQIQYCTIGLESMSTVHLDQNEIIMSSSANTCETGIVFRDSLDSIERNVNNLFGSDSKIEKLQLHIY